MPTRRGFLARLLATVPALGLLLSPRLPAATRHQSDPGVPRRMDLREEIHPHAFAIELRLNGKRVTHAVAYDLDADTVVLLARGLDGRPLPETHMERANAGVSAHWITPPHTA